MPGFDPLPDSKAGRCNVLFCSRANPGSVTCNSAPTFDRASGSANSQRALSSAEICGVPRRAVQRAKLPGIPRHAAPLSARASTALRAAQRSLSSLTPIPKVGDLFSERVRIGEGRGVRKMSCRCFVQREKGKFLLVGFFMVMDKLLIALRLR